MTVFLVGAGPGDPGLITVRGLELIKKADVILYDRLVNDSFLDYSKGSCIKIFVGKEPGHHAKTQDEINELIVHYGKKHMFVVRLKGGDPFVFGRGGEEAQALCDNGINFEVVPGITSAIAGPAYAGIPVTHREHNTSVTIMTGHRWDSSRIRDTYTALSGTLVILMGAGSFASISSDLIDMGYDPQTPVAAINNATTQDQLTIRGTLSSLAQEVIPSPSVIVVGTVAGLAEKFSWFDEKLSCIKGKKILVMRTKRQYEDTKHTLGLLGAHAVNGGAYVLTTLDWDHSLLNDAKIIVVTSANTVPLAEEILKKHKNKIFVAIGPGTRRALADAGIESIMPEEYTSEGLGMLLRSMAHADDKIVGIRSVKASTVLSSMLSTMNYVEIPAYDIGYESIDADAISGSDVVFFTSSAMVRAICAHVREGQVKVSIGPQTTASMNACGISPDIEARHSTIDGMVQALLDHLYAHSRKE